MKKRRRERKEEGKEKEKERKFYWEGSPGEIELYPPQPTSVTPLMPRYRQAYDLTSHTLMLQRSYCFLHIFSVYCILPSHIQDKLVISSQVLIHCHFCLNSPYRLLFYLYLKSNKCDLVGHDNAA